MTKAPAFKPGRAFEDYSALAKAGALKILGVDPSYRGTGVVLYQRGDECPEWFVIGTKQWQDWEVYWRIYEILQGAIEHFQPHIVAIEGYSFGRSLSTGFSSTVEVGGIIRAAAKCGWVQIPPSTWKRVVMGPQWVRQGKQRIADRLLYMGRFREMGGPAVIDKVDAADAWMVARSLDLVLRGKIPDSLGTAYIGEQINALAPYRLLS